MLVTLQSRKVYARTLNGRAECIEYIYRERGLGKSFYLTKCSIVGGGNYFLTKTAIKLSHRFLLDNMFEFFINITPYIFLYKYYIGWELGHG